MLQFQWVHDPLLPPVQVRVMQVQVVRVQAVQVVQAVQAAPEKKSPNHPPQQAKTA